MMPTGLAPSSIAPDTSAVDVTPLGPAADPIKLPPVQNPLPFTREEYERSPSYLRSAYLDFLILGKIPAREPATTTSGNIETTPFDRAAGECLESGELNALDFLWRESGVDPNTSTLSLIPRGLRNGIMDSIASQCDAYRGLRINLDIWAPGQIPSPEISGLSNLIAKGKISSLSAFVPDITPADLNRLTAVSGQVGISLDIHYTIIDTSSEKALGDSLGNAASLKNLSFKNCRFGPSQGSHFVEGMQKNRTVVQLNMSNTWLPTTATSGYGVMLSKNTNLEQLTISATQLRWRVWPDNVDEILNGAIAHPSLRSLKLDYPEVAAVCVDPSTLIRLVETNRTLTSLSIGGILSDSDDYYRVADELKKNTTLTHFELYGLDTAAADVKIAISDTLARNRALAQGQIQREAGRAFDPNGNNGLSDVGAVIANYVLESSPSLNKFIDTMAAVELSMSEPAPPMSANFPANQGPAGVTGSTATATTTATTGPTTTNTATAPPDSASS